MRREKSGGSGGENLARYCIPAQITGVDYPDTEPDFIVREDFIAAV